MARSVHYLGGLHKYETCCFCGGKIKLNEEGYPMVKAKKKKTKVKPVHKPLDKTVQKAKKKKKK
jgi:hypothetical protein